MHNAPASEHLVWHYLRATAITAVAAVASLIYLEHRGIHVISTVTYFIH